MPDSNLPYHQSLLRVVLLGLFFFATSSSLWSQNIGINVDGSDPDPSAILDVKSSDKGLLIPRMSSVQRENIPAPAPGLMVYDLTTQSFWFYSSGWEEVLSGTLDDEDWIISGNNMYSANSGDIGIGTNNPDNKLHLQRDDMGQIAMQLEGKRNTIASSVVVSSSNTGLSINCCSAPSWIGGSTAASVIGGGEWVGGLVGNNELSDYLNLEFSFSSTIPVTATITGIKMDVYRKASDNSNIYDQEIRLMNNGTAVGSNKALTSLANDWPVNYVYQNYGNNTDLWSYGGWTPTIVNAGNLGMRIRYEGDIGVFSSDEQGFVDFVRATVYYEHVTGEVNSVWAVGSLDGDFKINNQSNLMGTTEIKIGQDGVTELQGLRIPSGAVTGRVLTSATDGTASWQAVPIDGDGSSTNEIQSLNYSGTTLSLTNSNSVNLSGLIDDADADPNNEIQLLSLSGSTLTLTGDATPVDLSSLLGDDGDWTVSGNTIYTSNYYSSNCRVGIGTNNPRSTLYVKGELILEHLDGVTQDIRGRGYYTEGPTLAFSRSDTDTFGNQYAPHLGQELGEICFRGRVGSSSVDTVFLEGAKIVSTVVGHFNTARSAKLTFHTRPPNASDLEERMVISDLGKVGIGTDSPSELLHVNGSFRLSNGTEAFGRVLTSDVNGTASWQSLPTDGDSNSSNELQNIIAGTGLTGGGSSTTVSLNVMGANGLTSTADDIKLGGTLSESTVISAAAFDLGVNLTGTGEFSIRDGGNPMFTAQSDGVMVFNENSLANQDVRMESNASTHMLFIDAGLNRIGIKEDTPEADLHIKSDGNGTNPQLKLEETVGTDGARLIFTNSVETTNQWTLYGKADDTPVDSKFNIFHTGPGNIIQVLGEGRVGIRNNNPTFTLQLPNNASLGEARAHTWSTYSDSRIKRDVELLEYGLEEVLALRPTSYIQLDSDFKDGSLVLSEEEGRMNIGFIAQELFKVVPEATLPPVDDSSELWGVDYTRLIPVLTKAIQEQQEQIEELKAEVKALKATR